MATFDSIAVKFNAYVWHDQPYLHPQLHTETAQDFFDRTDIKRLLLRQIMDNGRRLAIIQGERRAGKTSMLRLLANRLELDSVGQFVSIMIPWQSVQTADDLAEEMLQGAAFELKTAALEKDSLATALRALLNDNPGKTAVICLDEFDSILEQATAGEQIKILNLINNLLQTPDLPLVFLLTLVRMPQLPSAAVLQAHGVTAALSPFDQNDLEEMSRALMNDYANQLTAIDWHRLHTLSGGWPYFAKLLLVSMAETDFGPRWIEMAARDALQRPLLEQTMIHIYGRHFDKHEKASVLWLAQFKTGQPIAALTAAPLDIQTAVKSLIRRGYLHINQQDQRCQFRIGLLAYWFPRWPKFDEESRKYGLEKSRPLASSRKTKNAFNLAG